MTHQNDYTFADDIAEKGLEAVPEMIRVLINQDMQVERSRYLKAEEYERTEDRKGHANGFALHAFSKTKNRSDPDV